MKLCLVLILLSSHLALGQDVDTSGSFLRDTSFSLWSATVKVQKKYPFAAPVLPSVPEGVVAHYNVVYSTSSGRALHLDLFRPHTAVAGGYPAVLLIHGGGWASGDRSMEIPMTQQLAAHGYVAATVEYRLSPEAQYPAAICDLRTAVRWMRAHATEYAVDTNAIAAYGCSAGGQLASLLGTTNDQKLCLPREEYGVHSDRIQAVVNIDGPVDLTHPEESGKDSIPSKPSAVKRWLGASFADKPDLWREVSPAFHVSKNTTPIAFINSSIDRYHAGRDEMIEKMNTYSIYSEVHTLADTPHPFWLFHPWHDVAFDHMLTFLDRVLKQKGNR